MLRSPRTPRVLAAVLLALALAGPARADSEPVDLPIEADLTARVIALDLRGGEVDVVLDEDATPQLTVSDLLRPENTEGFVVVEDDGGRLRLTQPHGDDIVAPRLRVKIVAPPEVQVSIEGERLTIVVRRFAAPPLAPIVEPPADATPRPEDLPTPPDPSAPAGGGAGSGGAGSGAGGGAGTPGLRLDVRQSSVTVVGVAGQWRGRDSHLRAEGVRGALAVDVEGGRFVLEGFAGQLDLRGSDTEIEVSEASAGMAFRLDHASLLVESGAGRASGNATASTIAFRRWFGGVSVQGDQNRIELAQAGLKDVPVTCGGRANEIVLEQVQGPVNVDLTEGRLTGRRLLALTTVRARDGAEVGLQLVKGRVDLELAERCRATVEGTDETVDLRVTSSEATLSSIRGLELRATSATVTATDVAGDARVRAGDSELDLDLRAVTNSPDLDLSGSTKARITLPSPCFLSLEKADEALDRVELAGCEVYDGRQRLYAAAGKRLILTRAKVGSGAVLTARSGS